MKPVVLPGFPKWRLIFAKHVGLTRRLRAVAAWSGWAAVVGFAGCIAIAGMAARGCVPA